MLCINCCHAVCTRSLGSGNNFTVKCPVSWGLISTACLLFLFFYIADITYTLCHHCVCLSLTSLYDVWSLQQIDFTHLQASYFSKTEVSRQNVIHLVNKLWAVKKNSDENTLWRFVCKRWTVAEITRSGTEVLTQHSTDWHKFKIRHTQPISPGEKCSSRPLSSFRMLWQLWVHRDWVSAYSMEVSFSNY